MSLHRPKDSEPHPVQAPSDPKAHSGEGKKYNKLRYALHCCLVTWRPVCCSRTPRVLFEPEPHAIVRDFYECMAVDAKLLVTLGAFLFAYYSYSTRASSRMTVRREIQIHLERLVLTT